jgi:hypothetical protein
MAPQRPAFLLIFAILHLTFGGIGLLCCVCGGVMDLVGTPSALAKSNDPASAAQALRKEVTEQVLSQRVPLYRAYSVGNRVSSVLSSILLVAAGAGLLLVKSWGRWLSVAYALWSLLVNLVAFVYNLVFFAPAYAEVFRVLPPQNETEQMAYKFGQYGGPIGACFFLIYPVVVLIVMLLPATGAAFRPRKKRFRRDDYELTS